VTALTYPVALAPAMKATLYVFSGLPGTGKTVLSQRLAKRMKAAYLRIDTIEQGLRDLCGIVVEGEGYRLAYRVAADSLRLGVNVIADSCNPIELTRSEWEAVARDTRARCVNIEVICSNALEHRQRIETRKSSVGGLVLPTWEAVMCREYHAWTRERIMIDTARKTENECFEELFSKLNSLAA
jgi:predicted kinase